MKLMGEKLNISTRKNKTSPIPRYVLKILVNFLALSEKYSEVSPSWSTIIKQFIIALCRVTLKPIFIIEIVIPKARAGIKA